MNGQANWLSLADLLQGAGHPMNVPFSPTTSSACEGRVAPRETGRTNCSLTIISTMTEARCLIEIDRIEGVFPTASWPIGDAPNEIAGLIASMLHVTNDQSEAELAEAVCPQGNTGTVGATAGYRPLPSPPEGHNPRRPLRPQPALGAVLPSPLLGMPN
jgi:hypothetical protein